MKIYFRIIWVICILIFSGINALSQTNRLKIMIEQADSLLDLDEFEKVRELIDSIDESSVQNHLGLQVGYYKLRGDFFLFQNFYKEAMEWYTPLLSMDESKMEETTALKFARAVNDLGIALEKQGKLQEAIACHYRSLKTYDRYDEPQGGVYNYENIAVIFRILGKYDSAILFHLKSIEYAKIAADTSGIGYNNLNMAMVYADKLNQPEKALDHFYEAKHIFERLKDQRMVIATIRRLAYVYEQMNDDETANTLRQEVLDYFIQTENELGQAQIHGNIGNALLNLEKPDSAIYHIEKSIALALPFSHAKRLGNSYRLLGRYHISKEAYNNALTALNEALKYSSKDDVGLQAIIYGQIAKSLLGLGRFTEAYEIGKQALDLGRNAVSEKNLAGIYFVLYETSELLGKYKESLEYMKEYSSLIKNVVTEERTMEIARIEYRNQLERERAEEQAEQEKRELAYQQELLKERWKQMGLIGLVVLITISTIFAYRGYRIKQKSNLELAEKNQNLIELRAREKKLSEETISLKERELASMSMAAHEKNTLLEDLEAKISYVEKKLGGEVNPDLRDLKKTISSGYSLDDSWDSFLHNFQGVHPLFFEKLKHENPSLTNDDLKLCAYLKIGMSNKQIASVIHLTPGSVKTKVNRLKKKLEMRADNNLRDFMLKYA